MDDTNSFLFTFFLVQPEWKIYYNLTTNKTFEAIDTNNPRTQYYTTSGLSRVLRIGFGPVPCTCQDFTCGCCTGINVNFLDFNRRACMNFTYDPYEFAVNMNMLMNDESVVSQSFSGKNPPAACMPVPLPVPLPIAPTIDLCVKFFNIHTPGYNLFMCMDFETRITRAPVLILHFDCVKMGADGIHHLKPEDAESRPDVEEPDSGPSTGDDEIYDEVFEDPSKNKTMSTSNTTMSINKTNNTNYSNKPTTSVNEGTNGLNNTVNLVSNVTNTSIGGSEKLTTTENTLTSANFPDNPVTVKESENSIHPKGS